MIRQFEKPENRKVKKLRVRLAQIEERDLEIHTPFIKLDAAMKLSDIAQSGGHAKIMIEEERVRVNGETCTMRGKKLYPGDTFEYGNQRITVKKTDEAE